MGLLKCEYTEPGFNATTQFKYNTIIYFLARGNVDVFKSQEGTEQIHV